MVLKDLLAITGSPGLFKFIAQGKNAVIVEHLETGRRTSAHGKARVSSLEDIAVFTDTEEVPLAEVFDKIYEKENGAASINHKSSPEELKSYFNELIPSYDRERVYVSDMKKIIQWYNILHSLDMLVKEDKDSDSDDSSEEKSRKTEVKAEAEAEAEEKEKEKEKAKAKAEAKEKERIEDTTTTDGEDLKSEPEKKGVGQRPTPAEKPKASSSASSYGKPTEDEESYGGKEG